MAGRGHEGAAPQTAPRDAMTEIGFYHLQNTPLERALPKLLEKAVERGMKALVLTGSPERSEQLNEVLWNYDPTSFLPHGIEKDGAAERQPVYLTNQDENPNAASLLILVDGMESANAASFARIIDMFDGTSDTAVAAARQRWKTQKDAGLPLTYWQQTERGGWEKKAQANEETTDPEATE
jgi:DNA polymerase III subunit chi